MIRKSDVLKVLFFVMLTASVNAHEQETHYDRIHMSVSATAQLENDTMVAILYAQEEGSHASELSDSVNKRLRKALDLVKKTPKIKHQTNAYSSNPIYSNNKIKAWRVRQSLRLESQEMALMGDVLGKLQNDLALQSMQFTISPKLKSQQDKLLIDEALELFEERANQVVKKLGRKHYKVVNINISTSGASAVPSRLHMDAMEMSIRSSAPAVSSGEQTVSVTVSGSIELE